jgi:hypothetical protein
MSRIATVRVIDQRRNLCLAVVVGGKIVERFFYGKRNRFYREGDDAKLHGYSTMLMSAKAFANGWRDEARRHAEAKRAAKR